MLPIREKPIVDMCYKESVKTYPNVITYEQAQNLLSWVRSEDSGLHRGQSNHPQRITATFSSCLVYRYDNPIYEIVAPLWDRYIDECQSNLSFIEPYEVKIYEEKDKFDFHRDAYGSVHSDIDRKINLTVQLSKSSDYDGGLLEVGNHICPTDFGTAIFFPAHYLHRVTEVTRGKRISLIGHAWGTIKR